MGEVVGFPGAARDDQRAAANQRDLRRERASALRPKLETGQMMLRPDQLAVAENLWRVLERVEAGGTKKASVLREAGIGSFGDSTKHLGHYAVNPAWPEERKNKARLNKKVKTYHRCSRETRRLRPRRDAVGRVQLHVNEFTRERETGRAGV